MPGIGLITNPRSRSNKRDPGGMRRLGYLIGSRGAAEATRSLDDLSRVAEEFKKERIDILGINGGDGTIHHTITAFIRAYGDQPLPPVALLRGGTMNTICDSLRIKGDPPRLLFELVDRYHNGEPFEIIERAPLRLNDVYGYIFGSGLIYNFLDLYYNGEQAPTPAKAGKLLAAAVASAFVGGDLAKQVTRRCHARVTVDGDTWAREDFIAISAATVEEIGLTFRPFYRVGEQPGRFPVLGFHTTPIGFAGELPTIFRGRPAQRDKVIDVVGKEVVIEAIEPVGYTVDGDLYTIEPGQPLRITLGPPVRLIRLTGDATGEQPLP